MPAYLKRIVDGELVERLGYIGAVLIEGPKACGKTATATQQAKTIFRFDDDEAARGLVTLSPDRLFDNPRSCSTSGRSSRASRCARLSLRGARDS